MISADGCLPPHSPRFGPAAGAPRCHRARVALERVKHSPGGVLQRAGCGIVPLAETDARWMEADISERSCGQDRSVLVTLGFDVPLSVQRALAEWSFGSFVVAVASSVLAGQVAAISIEPDSVRFFCSLNPRLPDESPAALLRDLQQRVEAFSPLIQGCTSVVWGRLPPTEGRAQHAEEV